MDAFLLKIVIPGMAYLAIALVVLCKLDSTSESKPQEPWAKDGMQTYDNVATSIVGGLFWMVPVTCWIYRWVEPHAKTIFKIVRHKCQKIHETVFSRYLGWS